MKRNVGLITFHRVYNYGAVIQAYSLFRYIELLGYYVEIIDFSNPIQLDYTNIVSKRNGIKRFIKTLLLVPILKKRLERKKKFDYFIDHIGNISKTKFTNSKSLSILDSKFDAYICGSDQIWNPRKLSDFDTAYMLDFSSKAKIAYAPSIGTASLQDLNAFKNLLVDFDALSCREKGGANILARLTNKHVEVVLDPTLLVEKDVLLELTKSTTGEPYLLYYSLDGYENRDRNLDILYAFANKFGLKIKIITPEWPYHGKNCEDVVEAGPEEFLTLIRNANLVCTNSFHGTALSIKLEKPFYVLEEPNITDERKRSILNQLDLTSRIISNKIEVEKITDYRLNYDSILVKLEALRKKSGCYLRDALRMCEDDTK